jgi:hypothetical protein
MEARLDHLVGCVWFWVWALVGFGLALGAVSLGPLLLLPLGLVALLLASSETIRHSAFGLATGAGGLFLLVARLQQGGETWMPGHGSRSGSCSLSPASSATLAAATDSRSSG